MALEKSTDAAVAANTDAITAIYESSATIAVMLRYLANALRTLNDAKDQIADAATVSVRVEADRCGALSTRAEEKAGQIVPAIKRASSTCEVQPTRRSNAADGLKLGEEMLD